MQAVWENLVRGLWHRLPREEGVQTASASRSALPGRTKAIRTPGPRDFGRDTRASVALESAIAISILVAGFAGLMAIAQESYAKERMGRAARAVARAVALNPQVDPCAVIRRELALHEEFNCEERWHITIDETTSASSLSAVVSGQTGGGNSSGDLVLVRIGRSDETQQDDADSLPGMTSVPTVAVGLARSEPVAG